ncbi:hypothetical protein SAMN05518849_101184 [Sphingobium sp. AP50]|uniref:hypothetical protein n=1 Tax=Sphingobium sp. AP50 TaxID=1884369 RepID=UPI0008AAFBED|nr:hypothetical protein [Sphingobium sp. AP50]SEI58851.1 hypothetical protein SAMN05518849_101184 [Sphingobium sp. AP50]
MAMHFWMSAGGTVVAASLMGLGLGGYVTSPQGRSPADAPVAESTYDSQSLADAAVAAADRPVAIHCTGCGPTLAERRWKADMAGLNLDAMSTDDSDRVEQDYQAAEAPENLLPDVPASPVHPLPPQVPRFAAGEALQPAAMTQVAIEDAPIPPPVVATIPGQPR